MKSTPKKLADGRWKIRIYPFHGSKSCRQFTGKTKKECLEWAINEHNRIKQNPNHNDNRRLSDLVELWWSNYGLNLRSGKDRKNMMLNFISEVGDMPWRFFTAQHFLDWRMSKKSMGSNSKNHILTYFKTMFNKLEKAELIHLQKNPLVNVENLKFQETQMRYLSIDEIRLMLNESKNDEALNLIIKIGLSSGFRWSEIVNLTANNIVSNGIQLSKTKSSRFRSVPLSKDLLKALKDYLAVNRSFPDRYKHFSRLIKKLDINLPAGQLTHVLRHSFASHFLMNGGDMVTLQKILGHTDIKTTMRYAHLAPDFMNKVLFLNPLAYSSDFYLTSKD